MAKSSAKRSVWLSDQIGIARKSMAEWPEWMKEAARFEGTPNRVGRAPAHGKDSFKARKGK